MMKPKRFVREKSRSHGELFILDILYLADRVGGVHVESDADHRKDRPHWSASEELDLVGQEATFRG